MPLRAIEEIQHNLVVKIADVAVAGAAVTYPWWRQALHEWSAVAADFMPVFGLTWLGVQIVAKVWVTWVRRLPETFPKTAENRSPSCGID